MIKNNGMSTFYSKGDFEGWTVEAGNWSLAAKEAYVEAIPTEEDGYLPVCVILSRKDVKRLRRWLKYWLDATEEASSDD